MKSFLTDLSDNGKLQTALAYFVGTVSSSVSSFCVGFHVNISKSEPHELARVKCAGLCGVSDIVVSLQSAGDDNQDTTWEI